MLRYAANLALAGLLSLAQVLSSPAALAQAKISELTALTGANVADDDVLAVVDTSGTVTKKITVAEMRKALGVPRIRLRVYRSSTLTTTHNANVDVVWNAEASDTSGIFTPGTAIITVPADVTECTINATANWQSNSVGNRYHIWELKDASNVVIRELLRDVRPATFETTSTLWMDWFACAPGERLVMRVLQSSGSTINLNGSAVFTFPQPTEATLSFR